MERAMCNSFGRGLIALLAPGAVCALACAAAAQEGSETEHVQTVTLRADQATADIVLEVVREGEPLELRVETLRVMSALGDEPTATVEVDLTGQVHVLPPEPEAPRVMMGVLTEPLTAALAAQLGVEQSAAIVVAEVVEGHPAEEAGVRAYDVITAVDGESPVTQESLRARVEACEPGETLVLKLIRAGVPATCDVTVRAYEEPQSEATLSHLLQLDYLTASRIATSRPGVPLVIEAEQESAYVLLGRALAGAGSSPAQRLREELMALKERIAAIESIIAELESE